MPYGTLRISPNKIANKSLDLKKGDKGLRLINPAYTKIYRNLFFLMTNNNRFIGGRGAAAPVTFEQDKRYGLRT